MSAETRFKEHDRRRRAANRGSTVLLSDSNSQDRGNLPELRAVPRWVIAVGIFAAVLFGAGAAIVFFRPAMLSVPGAEINSATRVFAGYVVARNGALAVMLLIAVGTGARQALSTLLLLAGLVQVFDAVMDVVEGRWPLVGGILVLSTLFLFAGFRTRAGQGSSRDTQKA